MSAKTSGEEAAAAAMESSTTSEAFRVTVLRSRKTSRVLFLEAGKDFVDTLLSFLLLPVGTIIHMLSKGGEGKPLGGISSIFESVEKMDCSLLYVEKTHLVEPRPAAASMWTSTARLLGMEAQKIDSPCKKRTVPPVYYMWDSCYHTSSSEEAQCTLCFYSQIINRGNYTLCTEDVLIQEQVSVKPQDSSSSGALVGFVKESIPYLVTDKLEIMPSTAIRSITVLNKLEVGSIADLDSTDITVTITQILQLLQASLTSSTCLNDVFGKQ